MGPSRTALGRQAEEAVRLQVSCCAPPVRLAADQAQTPNNDAVRCGLPTRRRRSATGDFPGSTPRRKRMRWPARRGDTAGKRTRPTSADGVVSGSPRQPQNSVIPDGALEEREIRDPARPMAAIWTLSRGHGEVAGRLGPGSPVASRPTSGMTEFGGIGWGTTGRGSRAVRSLWPGTGHSGSTALATPNRTASERSRIRRGDRRV